jgi:hypothetical protein
MSNGPRDQLPGAPSRTPSPRDDRRGRLGWLLLPALALLPFVVFYRAALLRAVFFAYDVQNYFYAYLPIGPGAVRRGELPLWNPYAFSGMPLLADGQTALFYPPNWLFYVLPAAAALNYATLVQFAIASVGMFLFLRSLGLHRAPATLGAVAYTFCGFLSARIVHLSIMSGAALIPVAFLCVERAFRAQHDPAARPAAARRWVVAAAASVAAQAVAGHPQVPVLTAIALGLYSLVRAAEQRHRTGTVRALFRLPSTLVAIYVLGYGLAAIQLLPWLELARSSVRGAKAPFEFVFGAVMNRSDGLLQLFPFLFGTLQPGPPRAMSDAHVLAVRTWEHAAYIGMLPLGLAAFAALGLLRRPAGDRDELRTRYALLYLVLLLAVALVLAAGKATPVAHLVYLLPVIGKLREPARALALFDFSVAALAAFGLQRVAAAPLSPARGGPRSLALIGVLLAAVPCAAVWLAPQPWFQHALRLPPQAVEHLQWQRWTAQLPVAFALASAALLIWWSRRRATGFTRAAAVALVLLDVGTAAALFTPTADARYYERRPASLSALGGEPGTFRKTTYLPRADVDHATARESLAISWNMVYGVEDVNGFNSLQTRRYTDYLFGPGEDDVSYGALASEPLLRPESPILSSLNVKYLFVPAAATSRCTRTIA